MSTADAPRSAGERGLSAIEMAISIVVISLVSLAIQSTISAMDDAERYLSGIRKSTERGQQIARDVREYVSASRKLFGNDSVGQDYLDALDLSAVPVDPAARLPVFDETGSLGPDTAGDPRTGNIILFVEETDSILAVAGPLTGLQRAIDGYRFVAIYPHVTSRYVIAEQNRRLARDMVVWRSEGFPSYSQIMEITDLIQRRNVVADLYNTFGFDFAWDPNGDVDNAFYALDSLGNIASSPASNVAIAEDVDLSDRGRLVYANVQLARTNAGSHPRRSIFTVDDPAIWVPDGFEVKVVGASGSRKVWIHIVVETQSGAGKTGVHGSTVIASVKDL